MDCGNRWLAISARAKTKLSRAKLQILSKNWKDQVLQVLMWYNTFSYFIRVNKFCNQKKQWMEAIHSWLKINVAVVPWQVKFTLDSPAQGNRKLITLEELYNRHFTDERGEFQLELTVSNIRTVFETEIKIPDESSRNEMKVSLAREVLKFQLYCYAETNIFLNMESTNVSYTYLFLFLYFVGLNQCCVCDWKKTRQRKTLQ